MGKEIMYERIYSDLFMAIKEGKYLVGDRVPSEKELSKIYGVSRITSKRALELLAEKGIITRSPGKGSFVAKLENITENNDEKKILLEEKTGKKFPMIGVIFDTFSNDFGSEMLKGIERECHKYGYYMVFQCSYGSIEKEDEAIRATLAMGVSGLIFMCAQGEVYNTSILRLLLQEYPMVLVDRQMKGIPIPCVKTDNYKASKELTDILIKKGHQKLCFISHSSLDTPTITERYNGFQDSIVQYDNVQGKSAQIFGYQTIPEEQQEEYRDIHLNEVKKIVKQQQDCTAFFAAEYRIGIMLKKALKELQLEKEIVAFDGLDCIYHTEIEFTHAKQDEHKMGATAVNILINLINGKQCDTDVINIPYQIIK